MGDVTAVNNSTYQFSALASKYKNFYAPAFKVKVDGTDIAMQGMALSSLTVETSIEKADAFTLIVENAFDPVAKDFQWLDQYLEIGKPVQIDMGYSDKVETVFYGYITSVKLDLDSANRGEIGGVENARVIVSGMDYSFLIMKGVKSRSWQQKKHSQVAALLAPSPVSTRVIDDTEVVHNIVEQVAATDYQFLCWMAEKNHYEFFISGKTMCFRKPHKDTTPALTLVWGQSLLSVVKEDDLGDQVAQVEVRSWNQKTKESITAKAQPVKPVGLLARTGQWFLKKVLGEEVVENFYAQADSQQEAQKEATAIANARSMKLVTGRAMSIGIPEIRAGKYVKFDGLGQKLNQVYYVDSATHILDESGYVTVFNIGGNVL